MHRTFHRLFTSIILAAVISCLSVACPNQALAAYDGIWIASGGGETGYFMITQVSSGDYGLIEFGLDPSSPYYVAYYGAAARLNLVMDSIPDACPEYYVLQFTSENTGSMTLYPREDMAASCSNIHYGVPFPINRF